MSQTQHSILLLEDLECQDSGFPLFVLSSGPYDDDGCKEDSCYDDFEVNAEVTQDESFV